MTTWENIDESFMKLIDADIKSLIQDFKIGGMLVEKSLTYSDLNAFKTDVEKNLGRPWNGDIEFCFELADRHFALAGMKAERLKEILSWKR